MSSTNNFSAQYSHGNLDFQKWYKII